MERVLFLRAKIPEKDFFLKGLSIRIKGFFDSTCKFIENEKDVIGIDLNAYKKIRKELKDPVSLEFLETPYQFDCNHRISKIYYEKLLSKQKLQCPYKCPNAGFGRKDAILENFIETFKKI